MCGNDASLTIDDDCGTCDEDWEGGFVLIPRPVGCLGLGLGWFVNGIEKERRCRKESECYGGREKSFLLMNENVPRAGEDNFIETL